MSIVRNNVEEIRDIQDTLVSGTNIKTVGGASLLGSGDIPQYTPPTNQGANNYLAGDGTYKQVVVPTNVSELTNDSGYVTSSGNTIIGTDADINTSGSTIIDNLYMTDGVITSHGTRTLTAGDLSAYTQAQADSLLDAKADANVTYTETEVDNLLDAKADQATTYTKTEVNDKPSGFKNYIINGGFDVWQRGTSFSGTSGYTADRIKHLNYNGALTTVTKVAGMGDFNNAIRFTNIDGSLSQQVEIEQRLEGSMLPNSGNLTLSFWVRGSKSGTIRTGRLINGTTGETNTGYGDVNVTTSWSKIEITITSIPTTDSQYYRLFLADALLSYFDSATVWLEMTGIQLEQGSVATPFEQRPYGLELSLCQRYYRKYPEIYTDKWSYVTSAYIWQEDIVDYIGDMRVSPSISLGSSTTGTPFGNISARALGSNLSVHHTVSSTYRDYSFRYYNVEADAEL